MRSLDDQDVQRALCPQTCRWQQILHRIVWPPEGLVVHQDGA